jgi:hypothetical protein
MTIASVQRHTDALFHLLRRELLVPLLIVRIVKGAKRVEFRTLVRGQILEGFREEETRKGVGVHETARHATSVLPEPQ